MTNDLPITLAISTDQRGFSYNATLIASILRRTGRSVHVRCWCRGFLPESFETGRLKVDFLPAAEEVGGKFPGYVGSAVFDRLRVIDECADWDRCLIMDYDQVALCDIAPLFDMDLGDALLAAKMQGPGVDMAYAMRNYVKQTFPKGWEHTAAYPYFSMGPLLNLKAMREAGTWEKLLAAHAAFGVDEQLSLTAATEGRTIGFDRKWNLFPKADIGEGEVPTGVIHWLGWPKPWHPGAKVWRPDIWEAERSSWEHLRMGIWDKPLAIEVEPDGPREVRALLERGWKVTVVVGGPRQQEDGETADSRQESEACGRREDSSDQFQISSEEGASSLANDFSQQGKSSHRPPQVLAELGLAAFPDLRVLTGGPEDFARLLGSDGQSCVMVRFGVWTELADWVGSSGTVPEYLVLKGRREPAEVAGILAAGYDGEARLMSGEWPLGGPLPRVLAYAPPVVARGVAAGEDLFLKRGSLAAVSGWAALTRRPARPKAAEPQKVGVLVIATARYQRYVPPLLCSIRRNFLAGHEVTVFLFTDGDVAEAADLRVIQIGHSAWPGMAIRRHAIFREHAAAFAGMDYLYYLDADMRVIGEVGEEIFGDLVAILHPGYHNQSREKFTYEKRLESAACVHSWEGTRYYCSGVQGGSAAAFHAAILRMAEQIDMDEARGITAAWHDESHWNRYLIDCPPTVVLSPSYCWYPDGRSAEFEGKIAVVLKDAAEMRRE